MPDFASDRDPEKPSARQGFDEMHTGAYCPIVAHDARAITRAEQRVRDQQIGASQVRRGGTIIEGEIPNGANERLLMLQSTSFTSYPREVV
jgi:hypothetical protein